MANIEIQTLDIDGQSDNAIATSLISLRSGNSYLFTIELVSPLVWPGKQFLIVERVFQNALQQYRLNPIIKIYPGGYKDAFSFPVPRGVIGNNVECGLILSPRYYGQPGLRQGNTTIRIGYENRADFQISGPI